LDRYERDIQPPNVEKLALAAHVELSRSFRRFMISAELQSRVRSCTDCYLDPGERIVETIGSIRGRAGIDVVSEILDKGKSVPEVFDAVQKAFPKR